QRILLEFSEIEGCWIIHLFDGQKRFRRKAGASSTHSKRSAKSVTRLKVAKRLECVRLAGALVRLSLCPARFMRGLLSQNALNNRLPIPKIRNHHIGSDS